MREVHQVANRLVGRMTGCFIPSSCVLVRVLVHAAERCRQVGPRPARV
mgnify:CR=1 FL=1